MRPIYLFSTALWNVVNIFELKNIFIFYFSSVVDGEHIIIFIMGVYYFFSKISKL